MDKSSDFWKTRLDDWTSLEEPDRISEILMGLVMVVAFTGTISVSTAGKQDINQLLWAALGCNAAGGLMDGIMYLIKSLIGRAHYETQLSRIKLSENIYDARELIRGNISPLISEITNDKEIDEMGEELKKLPDLPLNKTLTFKNYLVAGQIFLLVFFSTFPVALPFVFFKDVVLAVRVSNCVALVLLFAAGFSLAKYSGLKPLKTALLYTAIGIFLAVITMALGG